MITTAVSILRRGGLVAFPTETVYGLGADAMNSDAVRRIFAAKGRPATNPLIVHVASVVIARRYAIEWPDAAEKLARRFWPGPLTLVLRKTAAIVDEVSAGGATIGLRVPNHPLALHLLTDFDGPVAAPSANRSNHISPTSASHVASELGDAVDLILDGGPCAVGIESTVLDLSGDRPRILRPGGVSRAWIEAVIGGVDIFAGVVDPTSIAVSPGQHQRHYSPRTPAFRFGRDQLDEVLRRLSTGRNCAMTITCTTPGADVISMPNDPMEYARDFYRLLREADDRKFGAIFIEFPTADDSWNAVRDRIQRATESLS